jgi:hypothetical protein
MPSLPAKRVASLFPIRSLLALPATTATKLFSGHMTQRRTRKGLGLRGKDFLRVWGLGLRVSETEPIVPLVRIRDKLVIVYVKLNTIQQSDSHRQSDSSSDGYYDIVDKVTPASILGIRQFSTSVKLSVSLPCPLQSRHPHPPSPRAANNYA